MADTFTLDEAYGSSPSETFGLDDAYGAQPAKTGRTQLSPEEEQRFQTEMQQNPWFQEFEGRYHEKPNLDDPSYDMRGAWKAGLKPSRDPYDNNAYHWPDFTPDGRQLKSDDHPTLWMGKFENATGKNPEALGLKDDAEARTWLAKNGYKADEILGAGKALPGIGRFAAMAEAQRATAGKNDYGPFASEVVKGAGSIVPGVMQAPGLVGASQALDYTILLDRLDAKDPNLVIQPSADGSQITIFDKAQQSQGLSGPALTVAKGDPIYDYLQDPQQREKIRADLKGYMDPREGALFRGGQAVSEALEKTFPTSDAYKRSLPGMVAQGFGSTLGFAGGGLALKAFKVPSLFSTAGLGAMVEGSQQFNQALDQGASLETAIHVGVMGMGIGTTEALPIERFFGRLDKLSGGAVRTAFVNAAKSAGEEGAQEALQTTLENLVTKYNIDPDQEIGQGVGTSGGIGGTVGGSLAFAATLLFGKHATSITPAPEAAGAEPAPSAVPGAPPPAPSPSGSGHAPKPAGIRETAAATPPEVTPEDVASPLPTDLIAQGKKVIADAEAAKQADTVLEKVQLPATGTRVTVTYPGGKTASGVVSDAFTQANAELGIEDHGVRIKLDDGTTFEEFSSTIRQAGVTITPEVKPAEGEKAQPRGVEAGGVGESILNPEGENAGTIAPVAPAVIPTAPTFTVDEAYTAPTQEQPQEASAPEMGSDVGHGFRAGPDGYKYRVGTSGSTGGVTIEKRSPNGNPSTFYIGSDGKLIDADNVNFTDPSSIEKIWNPADPKVREEGERLLGEAGKLALGDPQRKAILNQLRELVTTGKVVDQTAAEPAPSLKEKVAAKRAEKQQGAEPSQWRLLGQNVDGDQVFEDQRGVRSVVSDGVRSIETVGIKPDGGIAIDKARRGSAYQVAEAVEPTKPAGKVTPQVAPIAGMTPLGAKPAEKTEAGQEEVPDWFKEYTQSGREELARKAGYSGPDPARMSKMNWQHLTPQVRKDLEEQHQFEQATARTEASEALAQQENTPKPQETQEKPATPVQASKPGYGTSNKLFTADAAEKARQTLRRKLQGQLNSGVDPEVLLAGIQIAGYHIEAGARSFAAYSKAMIEDLGEGIRPFLRSFYNAVRDYPGFDATGMTPVGEMQETEGNGLQDSVPAGDARASAEDVQRTPAERGPGQPRPEEGRGSEPAVERPAGEGAQERERDREESSPSPGSGRTGARNADNVPAGPAERDRGPRARRPDAQVKGENYSIEPGALQEERGWKTKAQDNIRAIELMRKIEAEGRPATRAEQEILARYVGWGGIRGAFPDTNGEYGQGFKEVGARLKELLSDTEYATARRSIQYAHYTSETIVRGMWDAAARLGFKGGQVFEPGMGVGNFAGLMPPDLAAATTYSGLELDHTTARIARLLYPKWGVRQDDFTKAPLPKDTYDLVIGNPPFADVAIKSDPEYAKHGFLLHDYFFAKSLDAVRPGGLLMFISSAGTMNKLDSGAREYLADRAELVGAIRLPGDAFEKNAGTSVTTDIIVLRKRLPGETVSDRSWTEVAEVTLPDKTGKPTKGNNNAYFIAHPEMVLGEEGFFDKLYAGRYGVRSIKGEAFEAKLDAAIARLPEDVMSDWASGAERAAVDFGTAERKEGTFYLTPDGKLHQMRGGVGVPVKNRGAGVEDGRSAQEIERIKGLIPIRDSLRAVYAADLADDKANGEKARKRLNDAYDAFVKKYGPINLADIRYRRPNRLQMEALRSEAREEARFAGETFDEGSFDPSEMIEAKKSLAEIARARAAAQEAAEKAGRPWSEGSFSPEDVPDLVLDRRPNIDPFRDDPESYRLRAIEHYNDATNTAEKSLVFTENVITKERPPQINSVNDALLLSLNRTGRVDLPMIAKEAKISEAEAIDALGDAIFRVPNTEDQWEIKDAYLSGDVRKKLRIAQAAADQDPAFRRNVEMLRAVQPAPLPPSEIDANLGMPWIPTEIVNAFGKEALGLERLKVSYQPALAQWQATGDTTSPAATTTWGTPDMPAPKLVEAALNRETVKVYRTEYDGMGKKTQVLDPVATQAAQDKVAEIKVKFREWVYADETRAERLAGIYNEDYNNLVVREYDGSYLTTPGVSAAWSWRPHQTRVIARIIQSGNTYMAHAVGAGKTSAMIGAGMEMRRLGLARKPMYVVPNHMLAQFTKEFYEQYPTARIAVADERQFHTDRRKQFIADVASQDLDAVIITHSAFGLIPVSDAFQDNLIQEMIDEYREVLNEFDAKDPETRITRRRLENQIERLEQRLSGKASRKTDQVFTFEEMGTDFLFVDEAHLFRKLDFSTRMSNLKGVNPVGSKASFDLYVKTRYLHTRNPGRNLVLASGTPITNTMAELYTVSRYIQPDELDERGLKQFDAWAGAFGDTVTELEQDAAGGYTSQTRFAKFVNTPQLSAMVRQQMDVVTSNQLAKYVTRPALKGGQRKMNLAEKSDILAEYQEGLAARMQAIKRRKGPPKKGDDIILNVINDGRHAAIDMRLVDPNIKVPEKSKLDLLVDNVFETWEATKRQPFFKVGKDGYEAKPFDYGPATQMVFANLGLNRKDFSVPRYIISELVRRGVPRSDIAQIEDYSTHVAKQRLFNDMNEGKVRILIGSTQKMATGVNAQRRLAAIHNLDPLWYPADDEQRNGRGIRQGNQNREIEINDYSTKGTYDSQMWSLMEKKARFIQGFFEGDATLRSIEDLGAASQYEQAKAMTTNDPRIMQLTEYRQNLERAERRKSAFDQEIHANKVRVAEAKRTIEHYEAYRANAEKDLAQRIETKGEEFKAKAGDQEFTDRAEFGNAILARMEELRKQEHAIEGATIGEIGGFKIKTDVTKGKNETGKTVYYNTYPYLVRNGGRNSSAKGEFSARGLVQSLEAIIRNMPGDLEFADREIAAANDTVAQYTPLLGKKFEGQPEINDLRAKVDDLEGQLEAASKAQQAPEQGQAETPEGDDEVSVSAPRGLWTPVSWTPEKMGEWNDGRPDFHAYRLSEGLGFSRAALDQAAREWVLARGGASVEYLVAVNGDRDVSAAGTINVKNRSLVPMSAVAWLRLPNQNVTVHHNHPNETSLSPADSAILGFPGASWIVAHGSDRDSVYAARRGPLLEQARDPNLTGRIQAIIRGAHDFAEGHALDLVKDEFLAWKWTPEEGDLLFTHAANLALAKVGLTDYIAAGSLVEKVNARAEEIADAIAPQVKDYIDGQSFFEEVSISDRPAGILPAAEAMARISGQPAGARPVQSQRGVGDEEGRGAPGGLSGGSEDSGVNVEQPAFHGSPHHGIKRFSTKKIGTGEGAQSFGWGLYFAGNKSVAAYYREKLTRGSGVLIDGLDIEEWAYENAAREADVIYAVAMVRDHGYAGALDRQQQIIALENSQGRSAVRLNEELIVIKKLKDAKITKPGGLYHVELAPTEDEYLDLDKSMAEQSPLVKEVISRNFMLDLKRTKLGIEDTDFTGADFYNELATRMGREGKNRMMGILARPDAEGASKRLLRAGIRGNRFLDAASRQRGAGTSNYVIFDDKDVSITNVEATRRSVAAFDSAESERRWQDARQGAASQESMLSNLSAWWERLAHGFTRHYIELPNIARFSDVREQLRKLEAAPQASKEQVVRILKDITKGMTRADLDLFTRKVVLDDLTWEASQDHELPFGFTAEDVAREKAKIDAIVEGRPEIAQAVRTRKLIVRRVADQLVEAGVLNREQVQNPAYYRHQVLDFARAEIAYAKGVGKKLKSPYWARRHGSALDINANLLEAEFDWLHKAFTDVATAKTIKWIRDSEHNVRRQVIAAAKAHNDAGVAQALAADLRDNGYVDSKGRQTSPLNEQWKSFRQRIAFGLSTVRKAIENGMDIPPQFQDAADRVSDPDANDADIFPFLAHILDNDLDGAIGAAMAFKAIAARRQFVKDLLGNRYADTSDMDGLIKMGLAPEGYVSWQPNQPNKAGKALVFYTSKSLPEHAIERFAELAMSDLPLPPEARGAVKAAFMAQARDVLAVGGPQYQMVIPQELADTLSSLRDQHVEDLIHYLAEVPLGWWKKWVLINPRRVLKYNINNFSGDLDAVIAGNPRAVKKLPQAIKELMDVMYRGQTPSETFKDAVERGVFDSALSVQEIPDVNKLAEFSRLLERPSILKQPQRLLTGPAGAIWRGLSRFTSFRENWLRYAAYLDYVEQIENGAPMSKVGYGAALPAMVDAIEDNKDRAALLARELVGDYGAVSHYGQGIRRRLIPFYSWMEINTKRYWRLSGNAYRQGVGKGLATSGYLGAAMGIRTTLWLALRMALMYGLVQLWNHLFFPDEEEKMSPEDRARLHLNLGTWDGEAKTLRFQGAFSDFLGWIGFEDVKATFSEIEKGRADYVDVLTTIAKAPVNKVLTGITPLITAPVQTLSGYTFWPDVFNPRPIRDEWRNLAQTFSLENEYDLAAGRPSRGYAKSFEGAVITSRDQGEQAYNNTRTLTYNWLQREKGQEGSSNFSTPKSEAIYQWKLAKRFGDTEAETRLRRQLREMGVTGDKLKEAIDNAHPLARIPMKDRARFKRSLDSREIEQLNLAIRWYRETFGD